MTLPTAIRRCRRRFEWSYAPLSEAERHVFDGLGVFPEVSTPQRRSASPAQAACSGGTSSMPSRPSSASRWSLRRKGRTRRAATACSRPCVPSRGSISRPPASWTGCSAGPRSTMRRSPNRPGPNCWAPGNSNGNSESGPSSTIADRRHVGIDRQWSGAPGRVPDRGCPGLLHRVRAQYRRRLGRTRPCRGRGMPARDARNGHHRGGMERVLGRRPPACATAGRGRPARTGIRRSEQPGVATRPAVPDLRADRAAATWGRHRREGRPAIRGTRNRRLRRALPRHGGDGLDHRRRLRGGAAARHRSDRDSPKSPRIRRCRRWPSTQPHPWYGSRNHRPP